MRSRKWLLLTGILLGGVALRALYYPELLHRPDFAAPSVDAEFHDYWARALVTGNWTSPYPGCDPAVQRTAFFRPPGYPYFLAAVYRLLGLNYAAPRIVQMALGLLGSILAFLFARRWFGAAVGLILLLLSSTYWIFIYFEGELHAPPLLIVLLWLIVIVTARWTERMSLWSGLLAGLLLGVAALIRPDMLPLGGVILLWAAWLAWRRRQARSFVRAALGLLVGAAAAIAPATIRNYRVSGDFVLISSNGGINLFIGNNPGADGRVTEWIPGLGSFRNCFEYPALVQNLERQQGRKLSDAQISAYFTSRALHWIVEHPVDFLRLTARKAKLFWASEEIPHNKHIRCERDNSTVLRNLPGNFWFVLGACLAGLAFLVADLRKSSDQQAAAATAPPRSCGEISVLLIALILVFFLTILPFFVAARYRVPIIPLLMLFAAYGLYRTAQCACTRGRRRVAILAAIWIVSAGLAGWPKPLAAHEIAQWHDSRGKCYARLRDFRSAATEFARSVTLDPDDTEARMDLSSVLLELGRFDEAAKQLRELLRRDPRQERAILNLGVALAKQGQFDEAAAQFREALRLEPGNTKARLNLGAALAKKGLFAEAAEQFEEILRTQPEHPEARRYLDLIETEQKKTRLPLNP